MWANYMDNFEFNLNDAFLMICYLAGKQKTLQLTGMVY